MRFFRKTRALARTGRILTLGALVLSVPATAMANSKYAGIVVDAKTGRTLYESSANAYRYPASLTKIMTLYVVFEELEAGRLSLSTPLKVSARASKQPPSKLGLKPGSTISVKDAILALVTKSANDVASVVAENIGGSEKAFTARMTRTARQLGMSKTTFVNPHGLPNSGQRTSAHDMARLGIAIQERFPQYYSYFKTRAYKYRGRTYGNHNKLLGRVKGVDGIKTGYIRASGFNLVTSVKRDGREIVAVVMGGRTGASRDAQMAKLIAQYLPKASRGAKTAPLVATRGLEPTFVAAALDNPPLPVSKPGVEVIAATGEPMLLSFSAPKTAGVMPRPAPELAAPVAEVTAPAPAPVPGFGLNVPLPPKAIKRRFDSTFSVATALPPLPPESPDAPLTTNSISRTALLRAAGEQRSGAAPSQPMPAADVSVETVKVVAATPEPVAPEEALDPTDTVTVATSDTRDVEPGWQIQIAATETEDQAIAMLKSARSKASVALRGRVPYTEPVDANGQTLFRARFVGFETKTAAWNACGSLKKAKYACFAIYQ